MELRRLRYFLRIAAEGSLGQASRELGIAQPALGRQVQLLESELGVKLFQRLPKGMRLTEEGEYLKDALDHPLKQIDLALQNVRSYAKRVETALTLGLPEPIAQFLGPRLFARLGSEVPNLKLRIIEDHSARLAADLARGLVDIALLAGVTPDDRVFAAEVLREPLMLVGAPNSEIAGRRQIAFHELHRFPLMLPSQSDGLATRLEKLAARTDTRIALGNEIDSIDLAKAIVKSGAGYTILPPLAFREEAARGELASAAIVDPGLDQPVHWAVQPHWRVTRNIYNEVERVIFGEWIATVESGEWPANWVFDNSKLSSHAG